MSISIKKQQTSQTQKTTVKKPENKPKTQTESDKKMSTATKAMIGAGAIAAIVIAGIAMKGGFRSKTPTPQDLENGLENLTETKTFVTKTGKKIVKEFENGLLKKKTVIDGDKTVEKFYVRNSEGRLDAIDQKVNGKPTTLFERFENSNTGITILTTPKCEYKIDTESGKVLQFNNTTYHYRRNEAGEPILFAKSDVKTGSIELCDSEGQIEQSMRKNRGTALTDGYVFNDEKGKLSCIVDKELRPNGYAARVMESDLSVFNWQSERDNISRVADEPLIRRKHTYYTSSLDKKKEGFYYWLETIVDRDKSGKVVKKQRLFRVGDNEILIDKKSKSPEITINSLLHGKSLYGIKEGLRYNLETREFLNPENLNGVPQETVQEIIDDAMKAYKVNLEKMRNLKSLNQSINSFKEQTKGVNPMFGSIQ